MTDRTTKLLLALIVLALWGVLLRPVLEPIPARAAETPAEAATMVVTDRGVYVTTHQGHVFLLDPLTLAMKARAVYGSDARGLPTFGFPLDRR